MSTNSSISCSSAKSRRARPIVRASSVTAILHLVCRVSTRYGGSRRQRVTYLHYLTDHQQSRNSVWRFHGADRIETSAPRPGGGGGRAADDRRGRTGVPSAPDELA